ncbi:MAG: DUF1064 domain-containing protein [Aureibaculum sp.]|nr:DUF1064 domain-containing protein [Aureibaculum sp.]
MSSMYRGNKYNAKKVVYNGRKYDSKRESSYAQQLDWMLKVGEIAEIIPQYKINIEVNGLHICKYYMDFKIVRPNGAIEMHEVKGFETSVWKLKWKLAIALYPDWDFILIK